MNIFTFDGNCRTLLHCEMNWMFHCAVETEETAVKGIKTCCCECSNILVKEMSIVYLNICVCVMLKKNRKHLKLQ